MTLLFSWINRNGKNSWRDLMLEVNKKIIPKTAVTDISRKTQVIQHFFKWKNNNNNNKKTALLNVAKKHTEVLLSKKIKQKKLFNTFLF